MKSFIFKYKIFVVLSLLVLQLPSSSYCYELLINQPDTASLNTTFYVEITTLLIINDEAYTPHFGISLPNGWSIKDSIFYQGSLTGNWTNSEALSSTMKNEYPAPSGYYWWVSVGDTVDSLLEGSVSFTLEIKTNNQPGYYFLDYILGDNGEKHGRQNPLVRIKSNDHPVSVGLPLIVNVTNIDNSGEGSLRQALEGISTGGEIIFDLS